MFWPIFWKIWIKVAIDMYGMLLNQLQKKIENVNKVWIFILKLLKFCQLGFFGH